MADINAIVEEIKALSLLEVKELTDALKETFGVEAVAKEEAEKIKETLEAAGAKGELK